MDISALEAAHALVVKAGKLRMRELFYSCYSNYSEQGQTEGAAVEHR